MVQELRVTLYSETKRRTTVGQQIQRMFSRPETRVGCQIRMCVKNTDKDRKEEKPLLLMSNAANLNMASVKASGCAESKASPICLIISRPRSDCPRTAWAKWIMPDTYRQKRKHMSGRSTVNYLLSVVQAKGPAANHSLEVQHKSNKATMCIFRNKASVLW